MLSLFSLSSIQTVLLLLTPRSALAWEPDAGLVPSYTSGATVTTTSAPEAATNIIDGDSGTFWQSGACLPTGFLERTDLNLLLGACAAARCTVSRTSSDLAGASDASMYTSVNVQADGGSAWLEVALPADSTLMGVAVRGAFQDAVTVTAISGGVEESLGTLDSSDNYTLVPFPAPSGAVSAIRLTGSSDFTITEVAVRTETCFEQATVDFGEIREIGLVRTRPYVGGDVVSSRILSSTDGVEWTERADLDPSALGTVDLRFDPPFEARYLAVRDDLVEEDWNKIFVWELAAYDKNGRWGPAPDPRPSNRTIAEVSGVNGIWGWGTGEYSEAWAKQGPGRYSVSASHARNYHNMNWDVTDPDHVPDYDAMAAGEGTEAQWWLDWDTEYEAWVKGGLEVDASIQFLQSAQPTSAWDDPYEAGRGYGQAFACHFGPTKGDGLVRAMEVGNEPWDYPASFYSEVLTGMAEGAFEGDPSMIVLPCALQADDPSAETDDGGNYVGARIPEKAAPFIDALNVHVYSFLYRDGAERIAVRPEDPDSGLNAVKNMLRWRDSNMPGASVWVTEWGWDSDGASESCSASECVSERASALYAVRALLYFSRLGIDRATWYFFANLGSCDTLFCRSGLVASSNTDFAEKKAFRSLQALVATVGDRRFVDVLREDDDGYAYLLGDESGEVTHLVAWLPVDGDDTTTAEIDLPLSTAPIRATTLSGESATGESADLPTFDGATWHLTISTVPLVVEMEPYDPSDTGTDTGKYTGKDSDTTNPSGDDTAGSDTASSENKKGCSCDLVSGSGLPWEVLLGSLALLWKRRSRRYRL
jgi:serine/threonine-protein kinase ATR